MPRYPKSLANDVQQKKVVGGEIVSDHEETEEEEG